jgi:hypothetical protein
VEWYQKAAVQGQAAAQFSLGCMYEDGSGVPQDIRKAIEWYQKAVDQGQEDAQKALEDMHARGIW